MRRILLLTTALALTGLACHNDADRETASAERTVTGGAYDSIYNRQPGDHPNAGYAEQPAANRALGQLYASDNLEIQSAQVALRRASSNDVKRFAQRLVEDHQANQKLVEQVAKTTNVEQAPPPDAIAKQTRVLDQLNGADSAAFDRQFLQTQIDLHQQTIDQAQQLQQETQQQDVKALLTRTLPTLEEHLQLAQQLQRKTGR